MRIIAGEFKSRRLEFVKTPDLRPTMDRVKESLFNVLGGTVENEQVLDLFAGSGSLGLEALSRGAKKAVFVDSSPIAQKLLAKNLASLKIPPQKASVLTLPWEMALNFLKRKDPFDLVLMDPPYTQPELIQNVLSVLGEADILRPACRIVVEHTHRYKIPEELLKGKFKLYKTLICGGTALSFLMVSNEA